MTIQTVNNSVTSNRRLALRSLVGAESPAVTKWVRPSEWPAMPSITASDGKFIGILGVYDGGTNYLALSVSGNYTVDWGDGVTENFNSGVTAQHQYTYSNGTLTSTSYGYKCAVVVVTPQGGQQLTGLDLNKRHSALVSGNPTVPWLSIAVSLPNCSTTGLTIGAISPNVTARILERARFLNIGGCTNLSYLLSGCSKLRSFEIASTAAVTDMSFMFNSCSSLQQVPLFNTGACTNMSYMLYGCSSLQQVPLFNTSACTNMSFMLTNCPSLQQVPLFNTSACTDMSFMLYGCSSLQQVPLFNTSACTSMVRMFQNCYSLQQVPLFNTSACTNMSFMLYGCSSLQQVPLFNTSACTDMSYMLYGCSSLQQVPLFNTSACTSMVRMFQNCVSLQQVPLFNTSACTDMSFMLTNCPSLQSIPALNLAATTNTASFANSASSLTSSAVTGARYSISYQSCNLAKAALETIFTNLGKANNTSQAVTITSNPGADTAVSKASCGTTAGSKTVTIADTSGLSTGMICTGTGVSSGVSVTFQDSGDTVTLAGHGLANGTMVSFSSITSTTGISTYTNYWVVNATTNTFQLAATQGGAALPLTTNGSGTLLYPAYITTINTNTSVVLSAPASATGTATLSFRVLDTFKATSKGWVVTG